MNSGLNTILENANKIDDTNNPDKLVAGANSLRGAGLDENTKSAMLEEVSQSFSKMAPPPSALPQRDFQEMCESAAAALPDDFPRQADQILIAMDVDGTLLSPRGASPRIKSLVPKLREAGVHFVVCTGRGLAATRPVLAEVGIERGLSICSNGAVVADWNSKFDMGRHLVHTEMFNALQVGEMIYEAFNGEILLGTDSPYEETLNVTSLFPEGEILTKMRVLPFREVLDRQTTRLVGRLPGASREEFNGVLSSLPFENVEVAVGWTSWVDVSPGGCTKASGLRYLVDSLGLPGNGVVAVGDGTNDLAMVQAAHFGVAMEVAPLELKQVADFVTGSVEADGSAAILQVILDRL